MKSGNAGRFDARTTPMHQIGASKTAYTRFLHPPWHEPITARSQSASHRTHVSIAGARVRDATPNNNDIGCDIGFKKATITLE